MTLASIGRFHFFEQARALAAAGELRRFHCDDPRVLEAVGWPRGQWLVPAGLRLRLGGPVREAEPLAWFGRQLMRAVGEEPLVKINSAFALETITRGAVEQVWVDHGSLDERHVAASLREEAERWGDPAVAEGGNHGSAAIRDREAEEFARARGVVVASYLARRTLVEQGVPAGKIKVVRLGVDTFRFMPQPRQRRGGGFRILHAGPVTYNKGVHRLIDAFRRANLPEAELWIVGHAPDPAVRERFARQAEGLRVRFRAPVKQKELPALFADADLFVLATLADGFGLTFRLQQLQRPGGTARESATADRNDDRVEIRRLIRQLEAEGRGTQRRALAIERMDERRTLFRGNFFREGETGRSICCDDHVRTPGACRSHARRVGARLHHDLRRDTESGCAPRHRNGVIACAHRGDTSPPLLIRQ